MILNKVLKAAQAMIFTIVEYKSSEGSSLRERGPFPRKVQEKYTLELVATSKGSFVLDLGLPLSVSPDIHKSTFRVFLEKKGFKLKETHHHMYTFYVEGKKTSIRTRLSHGKKEYDDYLLEQMSKQLKLSKEQLLEFIDCPMSFQDYVKVLIDTNRLKV